MKLTERKIFKYLLLICMLPVLYATFLVAQASYKFYSNKEEIEERMDSLGEMILGKNESSPVYMEDSSEFVTPLFLTRGYKDKLPTRIYDRNGQVIGEFTLSEKRHVRNLKEVPPFLIKALLATEDRDFYTHKGYNPRAIFRAFLVNLTTFSKSQGGSTLTQQLAKLIFTSREKKISRKIFELFCARALEKRFTKDELLLIYLNFVYFGHGQYGINKISMTYYNKNVNHLSMIEGSHIISILANPTRYSPFVNPEASKLRHKKVISSMVSLDIIPEGYAKREFEKYWERLSEKTLSLNTSMWTMHVNKAPYFVESIRRELLKQFSTNEIINGELNIHTTLDLEYDRIASRLMKSHLEALNTANTNEEVKIEGALICIDNRTGEIVAATGGSGFSVRNQLIRYQQIRRPVGSLAKPFVYAWAVETKNYSNETVIDDKPLEIKIPGRIWRPKNYDRKFLTNVSMEEALIRSRNIPVINTLRDMPMKDYHRFACRAFGVRSDRIPRNLSIALGSFELTPGEVAAAYSMLTRRGVPARPYMIRRITDGRGEILYSRPEGKEEALISTNTAVTIRKLLTKVIKDRRGTAYRTSRRKLFELKAFGKTGTTQDYKDAWFAGATPYNTCVVWIGCDNNIKMEHASGGRFAAPVWMDLLDQIKIYYPDNKDF